MVARSAGRWQDYHVCQVARRWVNVDSFHTRLFGVVYVTCGDFHDGSQKGTASVHQILCQFWEKCYGHPQNDSTRLRGLKLESYTGVSMAYPVQDRSYISWRRRTHGDPQVAQLLRQLHEFNSSSVRIGVGPFATMLRRWELVMGHANVFWRKNWACTVSQPNLCRGSWQMTRSSSASTILRQSDNPPSGKAPRHQGQKSPGGWKAISRAWSSLSMTSRGLCTKNLSQQAKMWIPGSTEKLCGDCVKTCEDIAPNFGENRPGCFTMTTPRLTLPSSPTSFWRKTKLLLSTTHRYPPIWHPVTSSYSKTEIEAERTPVWYH